jgi:general secretion pathway protein M
MSHPSLPNAWLAALQPVWMQRTPREKRLLRLAGALGVLAALWQMALAPAWQTWQEAPAQQARLDAQTQTMQQLKAQAQSLQAPQAISRVESVQWLENNLAELGPGSKVSVQGERATLSLEAAPAQALARWLSLARERALAIPEQAQLQQGAAPAAASPANTPALLRGTLVLRLP